MEEEEGPKGLEETTMLMTHAQLAAALDKISERIGIADRALDEYVNTYDDWLATLNGARLSSS